jgi:hypothetical protein
MVQDKRDFKRREKLKKLSFALVLASSFSAALFSGESLMLMFWIK